MKISTTSMFLLVAAAALTASRSDAFVVEDSGISPNEVVNIAVAGFYSGDAYAGINKLVIDGRSADGMCIDPFHFSVASSPGYDYRSLPLAPKAPGTMGAAKADEISRLWSMVYSPLMTAQQAAGLQVAIWEIVGGENFHVSGNDYGAGQMLDDLQGYNGPRARLVALSGPGQDYVTPRVPDTGSTFVLLSIGSLAMMALAQMTRRQEPLATRSNS